MLCKETVFFSVAMFLLLISTSFLVLRTDAFVLSPLQQEHQSLVNGFQHSILRKRENISSVQTNRHSPFGSRKSLLSAVSSASLVQVLDEVGSGSYGTVHKLQLNDGGQQNDKCVYIGKRAWTEIEMKELFRSQPEKNDSYIKERSKRCRSYYEIEKHCLQKLGKQANSYQAEKRFVPNLRGSYMDDEGHEWMVFDLITRKLSANARNRKSDECEPAMSLQDAMEFDRTENRRIPDERIHHLSFLSRALGIEDENDSLHDENIESAASMVAESVVDVIFPRLLEILSFIHANGIVHRDVKPANILISKDKNLHLIDFGSAADLDTAGGPLRKNIGLSERVAISPIYAAPEIFINPSMRKSALSFDCFSVALIICQLLFQYLDERTDAGFHQQLQVAEWNLDAWLAAELGGKVTPGGLDVALQVLAQRPGLWALLQDMLRPDPWERVDAPTALKRLTKLSLDAKKQIQDSNFDIVDSSTIKTLDGAFLANVLESLEYCRIPEETLESSSSATAVVRPLQFVATFKRKEPLGLMLSEPDSVNPQEDFDNEETRKLWERATATAVKGEVYVTGVVPGSQADDMGIFEVGDRIQGVGELPLAEKGFERVVQMISETNAVVSPDPKYITLHFDRKRFEQNSNTGASLLQQQAIRISEMEEYNEDETGTATSTKSSKYVLFPEKSVEVIDQGAWSSQGRRKSQEDRYILNEVLMEQTGILLAGVLDGHLGTAAANFAQEKLPELMTEEMLQTLSSGTETDVGGHLEHAWLQVSDLYQNTCNGDASGEELCVADYDASEGILDANTGASDVVAGCTANLVALDKASGQLAFLNCGDSRCLAINRKEVVFESIDHKPEREQERFLRMIKQGNSLYSMPECRFSSWYVPVGDYEYKVARSLEGPFATARGIVSEPDVRVVMAESDMSIVIATDGLWDVMDSAEVARIVQTLRFDRGDSAADISKTLCSMALERGTFDNISVVILFLA